MSEFEEVQEKFADILMHLGTVEGTSAIGRFLPFFIASLLSIAPSDDKALVGLSTLVDDVESSLRSLRLAQLQ